MKYSLHPLSNANSVGGSGSGRIFSLHIVSHVRQPQVGEGIVLCLEPHARFVIFRQSIIQDGDQHLDLGITLFSY